MLVLQKKAIIHINKVYLHWGGKINNSKNKQTK